MGALNGQLDRYQGVIARLSSNQVQVKTWCVTGVAALTALAINNDERGILALGIAVLAIFFILDAYYLCLERHFRSEARRLAESFHADMDVAALVSMEGPGRGIGQVWAATRSCGLSLAVSPFYLGLLVILAIGFQTAD